MELTLADRARALLAATEHHDWLWVSLELSTAELESRRSSRLALLERAGVLDAEEIEAWRRRLTRPEPPPPGAPAEVDPALLAWARAAVAADPEALGPWALQTIGVLPPGSVERWERQDDPAFDSRTDDYVTPEVDELDLRGVLVGPAPVDSLRILRVELYGFSLRLDYRLEIATDPGGEVIARQRPAGDPACRNWPGLADDVGTAYRSLSGGSRALESRPGLAVEQGERIFEPAPPPHARELRILDRARTTVVALDCSEIAR